MRNSQKLPIPRIRASGRIAAVIIRALAASIAITFPAAALAQDAPRFYQAANTAFEPEIGILNSGVIVQAQGVVSQDLRYVTVTMQPTNTALLALQQYSLPEIGQTNFGFVGGIPNAAPAAGSGGGAARLYQPENVVTLPSGPPGWLDDSGMFLVPPR